MVAVVVTMDEFARNIRELLLSISRDAQEAAELLDARLAGGHVSPAEYIADMRATLERIQDATLHMSDELDDIQERS